MTGQAFSFSLDPEPTDPVAKDIPELASSAVDIRQPSQLSKDALWIPLGAALCIIGLYVILSVTAAADSSPSALFALHCIALLIGAAVTYRVLIPIFTALFENAKELSIDSYGLCALGVGALFLSALFSFFESDPAQQLWSTAESFAFVTSLLGIGLWTKSTLEAWLYDDCDDAAANSKGVATVLEGSLTLTEIPTPSAELKAEMIVRVKAGEKVFADSIILEGLVEVEERRLTGNSIFKIRGKGDTIFAGSTVTQGKADCKVIHAPSESFITTFHGLLNRGLIAIGTMQESRYLLEKRGAAILLFVSTVASVFWFGTGRGISFSLYILGSVASLGVLLWSYRWIELLYRHLLFSAFNKGIVFEDFLGSVESLAEIDVCAIDYNSRELIGEPRISAFELLDERIESKALKSVLASILSRSSIDEHARMAQYIKEDLGAISLHEIDSLKIVEDPSSDLQGLLATVQGVPFVMGSEELLVISGVQVLASEVATSDEEKSFFIAMNGEIVARFARKDPFASEGTDLVEDLSDQDIRVVLLGEEESEVVQPAAGSINLDLSDTFSAMSPGNRAEKIKGLSPVALIVNVNTQREIVAAADSVFGFFDEYHWKSHAGDITLVSRSLTAIPWLFNAATRLHSMLQFQTKFVVGLYVLLVGGTVTGYLDPAYGLVISLLGAGYLFFKRR